MADLHLHQSGTADELHARPERIHRAPSAVVIGWALGSIGASVIAITYNLLLLRYLTDSVGVAAGLAGGMIAVSKLYDGFIDPFVGSLSDRTSGRWGRRRPYLLASAVLCPAAMMVLFFVPSLPSAGATMLYILAALILFSTAYAIWSVPYMAMAAEMTDDYRDRSRLIAYRTAAGTVGQVIAASAGPWLLVYWGGGRNAYKSMAVAMALIISASCLICFFMTARGRFHSRNSHSKYGRIQQIRLAWENKPFRFLIVSKFFFFGLSATASASNAYFTRYVLHTSDIWLGTFYVLLTIGTTGGLPLWLWVGRRVDKKPCMMVAVALVGVVSLSWLLVGRGEPAALMWTRALLNGLGLGGFILFGQSMLPDTVEYDFQRTDLRREGVFAGVFVLTEKVSTAGGVALIGLILSLSGYVAAAKGVPAVQPASAVNAIRLCFAGLPAIGAVICLLAILPYRLSEARLGEMRSRRIGQATPP